MAGERKTGIPPQLSASGSLPEGCKCPQGPQVNVLKASKKAPQFPLIDPCISLFGLP